MKNSPTALDVNRRGFLGLLFGAAAAVVAAPLVERVLTSRWGALLGKLRGLMSENPVTLVVNRIESATLADAFAQVERWNLRVRHVYMHPDTYAQIQHDYARAPQWSPFVEEGAEPSLWGAEVHLTEEVSRKEAFVVDSPDDPHGVAEIRVIS